MCEDCGCSLPGATPPGISGPNPDTTPPAHGEHPRHEHSHGPGHGHDHAHPHSHKHFHPHDHEHAPGEEIAGGRRTVEVRQAILGKNDRLAERNRGFFRSRGMLVLNVLSSPGSGKTTLLSETLTQLAGRARAGVIVGDLATENDAQRLRASGAPVVQITTGTVCHLEAEMVARAAGKLELSALDILIIENVGNLVCPAAYDLGEDLRVVLLSVTEGEDKPLKYPPMFQAADMVILSKLDLAGPCGFNRDLALDNIRQMAPKARVLELSARTGEGMDAWLQFLLEQHAGLKLRPALSPD